MMLLNTSLLRERFVIHDAKAAARPIVAVGNRMLLPLKSGDGEIRERLVIRAQSMHVTLRLAAFLTREFYNRGPLLNRLIPLKWQTIWEDAIADYERLHNPAVWGAIYHNGRTVFQSGEYHQFLDVIEQCDIKNRAEYDRAVQIAEDAFKAAGKNVTIDHHVNIGVVIGAMEQSTRCGLILRAPSHTSTFNFTMSEKAEGIRLSPDHGLDVAASYLEGIQLAFATGIADADGHGSPINQPAYNRIGRLSHIIRTYEQDFIIRYRPDKPDFKDIMQQARYNAYGKAEDHR